jgi:hypothetical protein
VISHSSFSTRIFGGLRNRFANVYCSRSVSVCQMKDARRFLKTFFITKHHSVTAKNSQSDRRVALIPCASKLKSNIAYGCIRKRKWLEKTATPPPIPTVVPRCPASTVEMKTAPAPQANENPALYTREEEEEMKRGKDFIEENSATFVSLVKMGHIRLHHDRIAQIQIGLKKEGRRCIEWGQESIIARDDILTLKIRDVLQLVSD